ncbi:hypothetical protein VTL71DRAFT_4920 [Oculimacula yallundae]|uniref:Heterokaryon incompatibility domain-containing protein n=1 Tax=Oculimacula yallundae TaxID=86028 RepID=A0ABR4C514_9HELO
MEHLEIPEEHRSRGIIVPYLGLAPRYDYKGLIGFPERHGYDSEILTSYSEESPPRRKNKDSPPVSREFVESFLQEWLWFGIMHEFAIVCGRHLDLDEFVKTWADGQRTVNTEFLLYYMRALSIDLLIESEVPLDLEVGDLVHITNLDDSSDVSSNDSFSSDQCSDTESTSRVNSQIHSAHTAIQDAQSETRSSRSRSSSLSTSALGIFPTTQKIAKCWGNLRYSLEGDVVDGFEDDAEYHRINVAYLRRADNSIVNMNMSDILTRCQEIPLAILVRNVYAARYKDPQLSIRFSRFTLCMQDLRKTTRLALLRSDPVIRFGIALSIDVLWESLKQTLRYLFGEILPIPARAYDYYWTRFEGLMRNENWCLARTSLVLGTDLTSSYRKASLPSYESNSHMNCTARACSRLFHDVSRLHAQHNLDECNGDCQMLGFDELELIGILRDGGIPGISCVDRKGDIGDFEIVDVTGRQYIAISHVWSHGLGNPNQNALPLCQIERLFKYIQSIGPPGTFLWIDTLVVPVNNTYKLLAISRLRTVYEKAHSVLVIDRHLIRVGKNLLERQIQLLCSEWMRRLWTLQEGRLATRLYVQFRHEAVFVQELYDCDAEDDNESVFDGVAERASRDLRVHFATPSHITNRFRHLILDLAHRSATVPTDEPICLATLLGLPLETFKSYPTMVDIYRSLPELPPTLLFLQNTRMIIAGFRWAPSTFLNQESEGFDDSPHDDTATLMDDGLQITRSCIMFKIGLFFRTAYKFYIREAPGISFEVCDYSYHNSQNGALSNAGIILNSIGSTFKYPNISAILVDNLVLKDGIYYCRWQRHLNVEKLDLGIHGNEVEVNDDLIFNGEFLEDVTFCVD